MTYFFITFSFCWSFCLSFWCYSFNWSNCLFIFLFSFIILSLFLCNISTSLCFNSCWFFHLTLSFSPFYMWSVFPVGTVSWFPSQVVPSHFKWTYLFLNTCFNVFVTSHTYLFFTVCCDVLRLVSPMFLSLWSIFLNVISFGLFWWLLLSIFSFSLSSSFSFSALLVLFMFFIIPVMLMNFNVTFLCVIFCCPVILCDVFFLFLCLPIVIIYLFCFVIDLMLTAIVAFTCLPRYIFFNIFSNSWSYMSISFFYLYFSGLVYVGEEYWKGSSCILLFKFDGFYYNFPWNVSVFCCF